MKALIIGATGATGKDLVQLLLQDPDYTEVVIFVRNTTGIRHPKLTEVLTDFGKLENVSESIKGDVWFSLLGTTLKNAGSKERQWQMIMRFHLHLLRSQGKTAFRGLYCCRPTELQHQAKSFTQK